MSDTATAPRHTNRLAASTSPYLLQHAHNPVDWYPWGPEALERARREDRPILLSIGYSACHWCHVMERESFEDERVAALMNRHFVCIKVDREERPDLDDIYMAATLALNHGQGGWPMTVFLTPEQRPFFAGTYFPPADGFGRPGFATLLERIAELWETERPRLIEQAGQLTEYLQASARPAPGGNVGEAEIRLAAAELAETFDATYGGFGPPPKFPPTGPLALLLRVHRRTGDPQALAMVRKTLDNLAEGGIYDQIGGGFARYATDARWLVPHFEKMLYDNALLARTYLEGYQATGDSEYARVARETLDYILREMTGPDGAFYSATDADSEGEEGRFFVWTPAEVETVLGAERAGWLCSYFDITDEGNWEGKSIPHRPRSLARVAARLSISPEALREAVTAGRAALYEARRRRVAPGLDDKVLTAWNGLVLSAMAEGFRVLRDARYLAAATRAADFLLARLIRPDGGLYRTYREGRAHLGGYLEDYAYLAAGLLDLYEAGGDLGCLRQAERLADRMREDFGDESGAFYDTARGHERLIVRHRQGHDGATPSPNAVAAEVLARLGWHLDRAELREAATAAIQAYGHAIAEHPRAFCRSLLVVDLLLEGPVELALIGAPSDPPYEALAAALGRRHLPNRILAHHNPAAGPAELPLLRGKGLADGRPALYICRNFACRAPVSDPSALDSALLEPPTAPARTGIARRRPGRATPEATTARAARFAAEGRPHGYGPLGKTGLTVSRVGFGGYRVEDQTPEHAEALARSLQAGCLLIDTSANYTDGRSEQLVGQVLASLDREGRLARAEIVVVSKLGYVQGASLDLAQEREAGGRPFPEMVKYAEGVWHCIHPDYLADQLNRSLDRLQLETLDVCLLHNPEYFLADAAKRGQPLEAARAEFVRRLRLAFTFFEEQMAAGHIGCYGVSSNTAVAPAGDPEATSLSAMLDAAEAAGGREHGFRVCEVPLNLLEPGAYVTANTGPDGRQTVLACAAERGIGLLANRPLNAVVGGRMMRLVDHLSGEDSPLTLEVQLQRLSALEAEFRAQLAPRLGIQGSGPAPVDWFRWTEQLEALSLRIQGLEEWEQVEEQMVGPVVSQMVLALNQAVQGPLGAVWGAWRDRYLPELDAVLDTLRNQAARKSQVASARIAAALAPFLPEREQGEPLSRKSLWIVAHTPGVSSVLVGMRSPVYVDDAMAVLGWPPLDSVGPVYEALRARGRE